MTVNGSSKSFPPVKRNPHGTFSNRANFKSSTIFFKHNTTLRSLFTQRICFPDSMKLNIRSNGNSILSFLILILNSIRIVFGLYQSYLIANNLLLFLKSIDLYIDLSNWVGNHKIYLKV